jgi:precorrin-8X/cobalt-precorrin-8 methylmutase
MKYNLSNFNDSEIEVIVRLIHTTACFDETIKNIYFSENAISKIQQLLLNKAKIIVDVNMIKVGISQFYLQQYNNEVICLIEEQQVYDIAKKNKTTRSYAAVQTAILQCNNENLIFLCGNAPTFIYGAINTIVKQNYDLNKVAFMIFPVGFVNILEAKSYVKKFCSFYDIPLVLMQNRFGSSTMAVSALHAIYRLIKDYDQDKKYNGK